jgi:hypothetical protein
MLGFLNYFYGFRLAALVGVASLALGGLTGGVVGWRLQDGRAAKIQAAWDREKAGHAKAALGRVQATGMVTVAAAQRATDTQVRIETRYRTLKEKVRTYVPTTAPQGVIRADDRVPVGALVLLDAAARGDDPDGISVTAGHSYDLASPVRFAELVGGYVENLGIGRQNAEQLKGLQGWVREQQAIDGP